MSVTPWAWYCTQCELMVPHSAVEARDDGCWWHWDALRRAWCGVCEKVELR